MLSVHLSFSYSLNRQRTCRSFQLLLVCPSLHSGLLTTGGPIWLRDRKPRWGGGPVTRHRVTHDSRPLPPPSDSWERDAVWGREPVLSLAVNGSSLPWLSLQSWWCSWGSVRTPPGSSAPPLPTADESVRPFWPVPVDTRMSLPAPPLWRTYTVTWGRGGRRRQPLATTGGEKDPPLLCLLMWRNVLPYLPAPLVITGVVLVSRSEICDDSLVLAAVCCCTLTSAASAKCINVFLSGLSSKFLQPMHLQMDEHMILAFAREKNTCEQM